MILGRYDEIFQILNIAFEINPNGSKKYYNILDFNRAFFNFLGKFNYAI